uniref:Decapping nuclease n=2 Tax=Biomphalaria glabrata TaxID=6526 RepID=A0A2C9JG92_BIOGL
MFFVWCNAQIGSTMKRSNLQSVNHNQDCAKKLKTIHLPEEGNSFILETLSQHHDKPFPFFKEPKEIGSFSIDEKRQFQNDRRQLRIYSPPSNMKNCHFDLRLGYSSMIKKDESIYNYLNNLLSWIMSNKQTVSNLPSKTNDQKTDKFERLNTDFVCWRGLLTKLACIPYENKEDILLAVINFRGTYYMCEYHTESKVEQIKNETPRQKEMCAWGFKFEQYMTADRNLGVPVTNVPVNTNVEFGSVACTRLGNHSLLFGAEVDCEDLGSTDSNKYVELKTCRITESQRQYENFCKYKLIKWWVQSFLIGVRHIICGFRDDRGLVQYLEDFSVSKIPSIVQETLQQPWRPNVCFNFLKAFLDFIKANIADDSRNVYVFRWQPGSPVTVEKRKDQNFNFLPNWYRKWSAWDN